MKVYNNPAEETWPSLVQRPQLDLGFLETSVRDILSRVKKTGDQAIRELTLQFDKVEVRNLLVTREDIAEAGRNLLPSLSTAIR